MLDTSTSRSTSEWSLPIETNVIRPPHFVVGLYV
jgi:hypothetical protein